MELDGVRWRERRSETHPYGLQRGTLDIRGTLLISSHYMVYIGASAIPLMDGPGRAGPKPALDPL